MSPKSFLPAADLDAIGQQLVSAGLYPDFCVIERPASGVDSMGAAVGGYDPIARVLCRVDASTRQPVEAILGGRAVSTIDYTIAFPRHTTTRNNDRISANGRTFYVIADSDATSIALEVTVAVTVSGN